MEPTQELIDDIYAEKVRRARGGTFEQKFRAGGEVFEAVIERMKIGVRMQFPNATDEQVDQEVRRRLIIARTLENRA